MAGNGWKVVGCICAGIGVISVGSMACNAIKHCADEKTERERIDLERTVYICDSKDRRAEMLKDLKVEED